MSEKLANLWQLTAHNVSFKTYHLYIRSHHRHI
jgi:hypothetical protein